MKERFLAYIQQLQDKITTRLETLDGEASFKEDSWKRPGGGGGLTRVIENGSVFEKGGVNTSAVFGPLPKSMQSYFKVGESDFFACGLSLVLHPVSPYIPTVHANWRYFEMYDKKGAVTDRWFGGGLDLTPWYVFEDDIRHFHQICKTVCDRHKSGFYPKFKSNCDSYFWNTHRKEARGVGGLFFDYCRPDSHMNLNNWYAFVTDSGNHFLEAYTPIVEKNISENYSEPQINWQQIRRGRYVEFNLVHDKGTLFGLKTNGRIESILMSLPPKVKWVYNHIPIPGSEEEKLLKVLAQPQSWV